MKKKSTQHQKLKTDSAVFLTNPCRASDGASVREAIFQEIHKRLRYVISGPPHLGMFTPFQPVPSSAVAQLFIERVVPMEWTYWTGQRGG